MIVEKKYNACGTFIPSPVNINYNRLMESPSTSIAIDSWKESTRVNHKHTVDSEESLNFTQYTTQACFQSFNNWNSNVNDTVDSKS